MAFTKCIKSKIQNLTLGNGIQYTNKLLKWYESLVLILVGNSEHVALV